MKVGARHRRIGITGEVAGPHVHQVLSNRPVDDARALFLRRWHGTCSASGAEVSMIASDPDGRAPERARILVVDDDPAFGAFLKEALEDAGYAVVCATDPVEALARLGSDSRGFDAVVTDERMPGLTGTELVAGLRAGPRAWYTPVVLVSAFADAVLERRAAALGVARVLPKPAPLVDILAALESIAPVW